MPKIVSQRLRVATLPVSHPDADALTAFCEQLLSVAERKVVMEHLARCGECREVVALALPASEPVQQTFSPSPNRWFAWPVLRWGFVAAGILAIASFGVMQYRKQTQLAMVAVNHAPRHEEPPATTITTTTITKSDDQAAPALRDKSAEESAVKGKDQVKARVESEAGSAAAAGAITTASNSTAPTRFDRLQTFKARPNPATGTGPGGPTMPMQWQLNQQNANQQNGVVLVDRSQTSAALPPTPFAKQPPPPSRMPASAPIGASSSAPAAQEPGHIEEYAKLENQSLDSQTSTKGHAEGEINRAKPADVVVGANAPKSLAGDPDDAARPGLTKATPPRKYRGDMATASPATAPKWTITSSGSLQRSLDQGATWQAVNVQGTPAASLEIASRFVAENARPKSIDAKSADKTEKSEKVKKGAATPVFRAVAAIGPDVWAGGSGGSLYHSIDAGANWTQVAPKSAGAVLTGDVVSLDFADPQHGKVTTSTSETWLTSDAGQTWLKQ